MTQPMVDALAAVGAACSDPPEQRRTVLQQNSKVRLLLGYEGKARQGKTEEASTGRRA